VLDVKPYMREFEPPASEIRQPAWASELMLQYW
jgi:tRNA (adenine37-N6)-methyltransferase